MTRKSVLALLCAGLLAGVAMAGAQGQEAKRFGSWGVDLSARDLSVKPGDNFFRYVNGSWLKTAAIPADRASIGGFVDLQILSEQRLRAIVNDLRARPIAQLNADERKLRDFYDSFTDTAAIEAKVTAVGIPARPVKPRDKEESEGFVAYGTEPRAMKQNGVYYDEVLMAKTLR